jgi:hypothetical protein
MICVTCGRSIIVLIQREVTHIYAWMTSESHRQAAEEGQIYDPPVKMVTNESCSSEL